MNDENLIPFGQRTESEQREIAHAGGVASGEARRQRKTMRTRLEYLMNTPDSNGTEPGDQIAEAIVAAATSGNMKAAKLIGDYCGEFKQRIELEETTAPPQMTMEEATAIYWVGIKEINKDLWNDGDEKKQYESAYFDEATKILGKEQIVGDVMSYCDMEGGGYCFLKDFFRQCNNNVDEYKQAIKEAAKLPRDEAFEYVVEVVKTYREKHPYNERGDGNSRLYYDCLVFYICARSEQYRKDHPEEAAPPTPPSPFFRPAPGEPYPEEW